ncbi:hypothetical protein BGW36DRAFT_362838 [Talaromyces proteolyticus]|uniref:Uncharacterized protein n=1 Tax=Talaromyces proteolyticus TaxID=1131652 RepID=A0AAD4KHA1_9EURO|nr:uncharacterized protein BGW36DRAFT_362838 [Talaromyces proteolyticus]KAH8691801.1 hypothetical protein BGW36DRAFT_362838 [Talaromyces proteolyticus]
MASLKITIAIDSDGQVEDVDEEYVQKLMDWLQYFTRLKPERKSEVAEKLESSRQSLFTAEVIRSQQYIDQQYINPIYLTQGAEPRFDTPPILATTTNMLSRRINSSPTSVDRDLFVPAIHDAPETFSMTTTISEPAEETNYVQGHTSDYTRQTTIATSVTGLSVTDVSETDQSVTDLALSKAVNNCVQENLDEFIQYDLAIWAKQGLWLVQPSLQSFLDPVTNCRDEMFRAGIDNPWNSKKISRRFARVRLVYWFEEECKAIREKSPSQGIDRRRAAVDAIMKKFYGDWDQVKDSNREARRRRFHNEKNIGKKWCQLANWIDPGILVISGDQMDTEMLVHSKNIRGKSIETLALKILNDPRPIKSYCQVFEAIVKLFMTQKAFSDDRYKDWSEKAKAALKGCQKASGEIQSLPSLSNPHSFIHEYLRAVNGE